MFDFHFTLAWSYRHETNFAWKGQKVFFCRGDKSFPGLQHSKNCNINSVHLSNTLQNMFDFHFTLARSHRHETIFPQKGRNISFCQGIKPVFPSQGFNSIKTYAFLTYTVKNCQYPIYFSLLLLA